MLQTNVAPGVFELAVREIDVVEQVNTASGPALALGAVVFEPTTTWSVALQPLLGSVTVTVYVFAILTGFAATFNPLLHANVAPSVAEVAVSVVEVRAQVKTISAPAFAFGSVVFELTIT